MLTTSIPVALAHFDRLTREADRLFERSNSSAHQRAGVPAINLWRDDDDLVLEAEIPGFRDEDLEIFATEDTITLRAERHESAPEGVQVLRTERSLDRFERTLRLPIEVQPDGVSATLTDGVLRVTLPVSEARRPKRIAITAGSAPALPGTDG